MPSDPPDPSEIPTASRMERLVIGFFFGALSGFFGGLLYEGEFLPALIPGVIFGLLVGGCGALFGKRVFDFLIALIVRFG
jgi:hypothetical protein